MNPSQFYSNPVAADDYDADDTRHTQRRYFPDTYLDSPVLVTVRTAWLSSLHQTTTTKPRREMNYHDRLVESVKAMCPDVLEYTIVDPDEYPEWYHREWQSTLTDELTDSVRIAEGIYNRVSEAVKVTTQNRPRPIVNPLSHDVLYWARRWSYFNSLVEQFSQQSVATGANSIKIRMADHTTVVATKDMWFLNNHRFGKYALLYDQVLMIKDVMFSRMQCHIACNVILPKYPALPSLINQLFQWHESCLIRYRNAGFEILKNTEALAKAYLSELTDTVFGTDGPYQRMVTKIASKEEAMGASTDNLLVTRFDGVLRSCTHVQEVVELFGLLKVSGHPLVDPRLGGLSAAAEARSPDGTLWEDAQKLDWEFKRVMLESYIRKWGSWPNVKFSAQGKATRLHKLYKAQFRGLNRTSYPLSDWEHCRYGQIIEFDYSPNYLDLIDDKAISLYRSNIAATWDKDVKPKSQRRLLLELIQREELNIKDIVQLIVRREVPFDWFIVSLHPKEREFKLAARMFSMLVLEIRIFFALTEANLADKIFPYLPQQTMTKSKVAISRQFLEMTKPHTADHSLRLFIEIDLSRWNLRWRAMSVNPVARTLNDMFGTPGVFDFVHEFFANSLILVRVNELRPAGIDQPIPPESDLVWYNHKGGFEGICQKLWTICTYSMVSIALSDLPLSFILLGQGDNQILSLLVANDKSKTPHEILSALRDIVTERIAATCASVNQVVKPEECLESTSVITYSKDVYVEGVYRPTTLKFHSRLFPHSSQIFPSVRTNVGAIFSTAVAGAEKSDEPLTSYYLACFYSALYLCSISYGRGPYGQQWKYAKTVLKDRFNQFVTFSITLPSEAGGFPVVPFLGFTYKGGSDPLGKSLASMTELGLKSESRLFNRMLSQMHTDPIYNPAPKMASLMLDPFSIPLAKPPTSVDGVAAETVTALAPKIRTREIRELLGADMDRYIDQLVSLLSQCRPLNPLVMRDILDCSVAGITETVSKMFVATRTLQNVVRMMGVPVVDKVLYLEACGISYMFNRFMALPSDPAPICTAYEITKKCRDRWFPGQDNPLVGLTTYQPTDFSIQWGSSAFKLEGINTVLLANSNPLETRGPFDPYVGSKTREKRSEHGFKIVGTDTASKAMRKLQLISSQTGTDPVFKAIIDAVGWTRTNTKLSDHSHLLPGVAGGTDYHRYAARAGHQDAFNIGSPNFATHLIISTDNMGKLSGGVYDYPMMVQEFVLFLNWSIQNRYIVDPSPYLTATLVTEGHDLEPLPPTGVVAPDSVNLPIPRFVHNPLAFLDSLSLLRVSGTIRHPALVLSDHFVPSPRLRDHVLSGYFRSILRRHSTGRQIADGSNQHFQVGTLDIAEAYSNGLHSICESLATVITDEAISNYMMTNLRSVSRWNLLAYSSRLAGELAKSISPLVGHPMLSKDPLVHKLGLYDLPTYGAGGISIHSRLVGYLSQIAAHNLTGGNSQYNHHTVGLFDSDNERILSESMLTALLCDLYLWRMQNRMSATYLAETMGKHIIPTVRAMHEEQDKVDTLLRYILKLSKHMELRSPDISATLASYGRGRFYGYKTSIQDMLKATRAIDKWGIPTTVTLTSKKVLRLPATLPESRDFQYLRCEFIMSGTRPLADTENDQSEVLRAVYVRSRGRAGLMSGSSLHVWSQFSSVLARRPVIVIGSGMGAVARVALDGGCPFVFGVDLRSTIPLRSHRFRHYKPPLVMSSRYDDRYEQLVESFTTTGDWFDTQVSERVMAYDQGDSTIVIDIQSGKHRHGLEVLTPAVLKKRRGLIMLRLYTSEAETCAILSDLSVSKCTYSVFDLWRTELIGHTVIILTSWSETLNMAVNPQYHTVARLVAPPPRQQLTASEWSMAVSDAVFNTVYVSEGHTIEDVEIHVDRSLDVAWGDYDSRLSYSEWTRWLRAKVVVYWLMLNENHRLPHLFKWVRDRGVTVTTTGGHTTWVNIDWNMARHLVSIAARVL